MPDDLMDIVKLVVSLKTLEGTLKQPDPFEQLYKSIATITQLVQVMQPLLSQLSELIQAANKLTEELNSAQGIKQELDNIKAELEELKEYVQG